MAKKKKAIKKKSKKVVKKKKVIKKPVKKSPTKTKVKNKMNSTSEAIGALSKQLRLIEITVNELKESFDKFRKAYATMKVEEVVNDSKEFRKKVDKEKKSAKKVKKEKEHFLNHCASSDIEGKVPTLDIVDGKEVEKEKNEYKIEDVSQALQEVNAKFGLPKVKEILKKVNAKLVSEIKPKDFKSVLQLCETSGVEKKKKPALASTASNDSADTSLF